MARHHVHQNVADIQTALADAWRAGKTNVAAAEVAATAGLSIGQVQSTGRQCFTSYVGGRGGKLLVVDDDRVLAAYHRGTFNLDPEQGWPDYWASKPKDGF